MNPFFIFLFVCVLIALIVWFRNATRKQGILALKAFLITIALLIVVMIATGRLPLLLSLPIFLLGLFRKRTVQFLLLPLIRSLIGKRSPQQSSQQSESESTQQAKQPIMDDDKALQILGLSPNPSKESIIAAHRALIKQLHPDKGGNDFLATQINLAREHLLKKTH